MNIFDQTDNFIELHHYACNSGKTEVPEEFYLWSCISLIAGSVQRNVWVNKMGKALFPNLYTFLIGPSGLGKGEGIDSVGVLARKVPDIHWVNIKRSAASLWDKMSQPDPTNGPKKGPRTYSWSKLMLVMPELSMSIGSGPRADDFIKQMTGLYSGSPDEMLDEGTRTSGEHQMPMPCINWLCGSTKEWMLGSITRDALYGGFIARCACVVGEYHLERRFYKPKIPAQYNDVMHYLYGRLVGLAKLRNKQLKISNQAHDAMENWYQTRESPEPDDPLTPSWKREHDFILKLCIVLALADQRDMITSRDFIAAEKLSRSLMIRMPELIMYAGATNETEAVHRAIAILRRAKEMKQDVLLRRLDITADRFDEVSATLEKSKQIRLRRNRGGTLDNPVLEWIGSGSTSHIVLNPEDEGVESSGEDEAAA